MFRQEQGIKTGNVGSGLGEISHGSPSKISDDQNRQYTILLQYHHYLLTISDYFFFFSFIAIGHNTTGSGHS
ncbi:hypothetical protein C0J52_00633 [Blattella germanica]|nr:hypothetical protein C0J52_00633 [Blattella germanica]